MFTKNQTYTALVTLMVLIFGYFVYEQTLGQITDFEQLSAELAVPLADDIAVVVDPDMVRESDVAAVRGFGPDSQERLAPLTLESRKKTDSDAYPGRGVGIFVYAQDYQRDAEDPRLMRLHPFSLVQIKPSTNGKSEEDEIITVRGEEAVLEFDQPIELTKMSGVKPLAGHVKGNVEIKTNGRTVDPADDMVLLTNMLRYNEAKNLVWTNDPIRVVAQDQGTVTGTEMELELFPEPKPGEPKRKDPAKRIRIFKNVRFDLLVPEDENFLGPAVSPDPVNQNVPTEGGKKLTPLTITSRGPFDYDMEKMRATFTRSVQVLRRNPPKLPSDSETIDQMESDQLDLQFRNKSDAERQLETAAAKPDAAEKTSTVLGGRSVKLQNVTATGKQVILMSDSEHLQATGNYLFYDADSKRAILKSEDELVAVHDNAIIHARTLVIEQGDARDIRNFIADGPNGWLEVLKENEGDTTGERKAELKIRWEGRMIMEGKPGDDTRLVTITQDVELEDDQAALKSDMLKVWLVPSTDSVPGRRKFDPIKLEATGNVSSHSPEIAVVSETLSIDILKRKAPAPSSAPAKPQAPIENVKADEPKAFPAKTTVEKQKTAQPVSRDKRAAEEAATAIEPNPLPTKPQPSAIPNMEVQRPQEPAKEVKQPLDVKASRVAVVVERIGTKTKPIRAWADGDVLVTKAPDHPGDDPLEVRGQTLQFERQTNGDFLKVEGSERRMASVKTADATIAGRNIINFDEVNNRVIVTGPGYIIRDSANSLTGEELKQPEKLRVDWERRMDFDGKLATFEGGVKAQQGQKEIHCQNMDVTFDRRINFREAREKKDRADKTKAAIESVDCDKDVIVYQAEGDPALGTDRYTTMRVAMMHYDSQFKTMTASGPGIIQILERNKPKEDENGVMQQPKSPFQLTQISFLREMRGDQAKQAAKFFENIHIVHTPVMNEKETIDEDNLNPDGIIVDASDTAVMGVHKGPDGTDNRDFQAEGDVRVSAREFTGHCDRLSYDQAKDKLVFDSHQGRKAQFYRQLRVGEKPQEFFARSITYIRKLNKISTDSSDGFNSLDIVPGAKSPLGGR